MTEPSAHPAPPSPTLRDIFVGFLACSLSGFGGALPWTRRMIVDRRRWMTAEQFNEAFSLSQFLPGPNVVNFSVVFGSRFGGAPGALLALIGLLGPPVVIITIVGILYAQFGEIDALGRILRGMATAAAGLIIAMVAKMAAPLFRLQWSPAPLVAIAGFVAVGPLGWPLPWVLIVLAPVSIALAWWMRR